MQIRLFNTADSIIRISRTVLSLTIVDTIFDFLLSDNQKYLYTERFVVQNVQINRKAILSNLYKIFCFFQSIEIKQSSFQMRIEFSSSIA